MNYSELLKRLNPVGIEEIGRLTVGGDSSISVGKPNEIIFPFGGTIHTFYAPAGAHDFWLDPEEIAALLRRFKLKLDDIPLPK